jgi:glycosyltransferase involved in cell wall biosynthesis
MENALVHRIGDVQALTQHITMLHEDRGLLERLRSAGLRKVPEITWTAAGKLLVDVYRETIEMKKNEARQAEFHLASARE